MKINFYTESDEFLYSSDFDFNPIGIKVKTKYKTYIVKDIVLDTVYNELNGILKDVEEKEEEVIKDEYDADIPWENDIHPNKMQWKEFLSFGSHKLGAVKYIKDTFMVGLREAKEYTDKYYDVSLQKYTNYFS